jgi:hypothetical protein
MSHVASLISQPSEACGHIDADLEMTQTSNKLIAWTPLDYSPIFASPLSPMEVKVRSETLKHKYDAF